ncbi:MAG: cytochrome c oxidase subunit III [Candidatus Binatia bacterium]|nr:MAG: cytochrome c oxidase subunit III [Candidatus Binatia bacterium]
MRRSAFSTVVVLLGTAFLYTASAEEGKGGVARPENFREWNHVKSMVILPGHPLADSFGGMHHVYVNDKGLEAAKRGGPYPDGTVFVFDLFESPEKDRAHVAGKRKFTAAMVKDRKAHAETGGWGFAVFQPDGSGGLVPDAKGACFSCHASQKENDFVFSRWGE